MFLNRRASVVLFILSGFSQLRVGCLVLISKNTAVNTESSPKADSVHPRINIERDAHSKCLSSSFAENSGF